jgi:hypothetical protein
MLPASRSGGILQKTPLIPANSRRIHTGLGQNRPEKYTEDRSSILAGIFSYRKRQCLSISCYRKDNRTAHIRSITIGILQYPSGSDRKQEHIRASTSHPILFLAFHQGFPAISLRISPRISPRISLGSLLEFRWDFTRISLRIWQRFH